MHLGRTQGTGQHHAMAKETAMNLAHHGNSMFTAHCLVAEERRVSAMATAARDRMIRDSAPTRPTTPRTFSLPRQTVGVLVIRLGARLHGGLVGPVELSPLLGR